MSDKAYLKTPEFRGSYVDFVTARKRKNAKPDETAKYGCVIPLPKTNPAVKAFMAGLKAHAEAAAKAKGIDITKKWKRPWSDGDKVDEGEDSPHNPGMWVLRARSTFQPKIIDKHGAELKTTDDLYSGAWYKVKLTLFAWTHPEGGAGVSVSLENGIKIKDDERFGGGGGGNPADDFADDLDLSGEDDIEL